MFAVWLVWKNKNRVTFEGKNPDPNLTKDIIQRATNFFFSTHTIPRLPLRGWLNEFDGRDLCKGGLS